MSSGLSNLSPYLYNYLPEESIWVLWLVGSIEKFNASILHISSGFDQVMHWLNEWQKPRDPKDSYL